MTGTGVHDETGRLGHHHDVVVLVPHHQLDGGVGRGEARHLGLGEELHDAAHLELAALGHARTVDQDRTGFDEVLYLAAGPAGQQRHRAVESLPRQRLGHRELLSHRRHAPRAVRARRSGPPTPR